MERWLDVIGYEGLYRVSDLGRVSGPSRRILSPTPNRRGYPQVALYKKGTKARTVFVHTIVANAFLGPRPEGMECRHKNGRSSDPRLSNLEYGTHQQNALDSIAHGVMPTGVDHPHAKLTDQAAAEIRRRYRPYCPKWGGRACAERYGVSTGTISALIGGVTWKVKPPQRSKLDRPAP